MGTDQRHRNDDLERDKIDRPYGQWRYVHIYIDEKKTKNCRHRNNHAEPCSRSDCAVNSHVEGTPKLPPLMPINTDINPTSGDKTISSGPFGITWPRGPSARQKLM